MSNPEVEKKAKEIQTALSMVGVHLDLETTWRIYGAIIMYQKKKGKFSVNDAVEIVYLSNKAFTNIKIAKTDEYSI